MSEEEVVRLWRAWVSKGVRVRDSDIGKGKGSRPTQGGIDKS